jgi:hypothetical protein
MALCLVPKILNAIDVIVLVSKKLTVIDPVMMELRHINWTPRITALFMTIE